MRFQNIIQQVYYRPWFITPEAHASIRRLVEAKIARDDMAIDPALFVNQRPEMEIDANGVAFISVEGVLGLGLSQIEKSCGATGYEDIECDIEEAISGGCKGIMFQINSPGGGVTGNAELASMIGAVQVPTMAYTSDLCCSAAYNLAASCDVVMASQSATVGSIGTIIPWVDTSKQWDDEGERWDPITNTGGDLKGAMQGPSLSEAQRADLQQYVDDAFAMFKGNVLNHRKVPAEAMRGNAFFGPRAKALNLVDDIGTVSEAYQRLQKMMVKK
jgi:protease-4